MKIKKHTLIVGPLRCNCSILVCEKTKEAIVIDAGDEFDRIKAACEKLGVKLKYAMHTHAHFDHIGAATPLKAWSQPTQLALHKDDEPLYQALPEQGRRFGFQYAPPPPIDKFVSDGEELRFGEHRFKIIHTPGHSPGSVCLHFDGGLLGDEPVLFTGDTLFQKSVGRTDLWGGDQRKLVRSIKERLFSLDEQTLVHPGHGDSTTIGFEVSENPYV